MRKKTKYKVTDADLRRSYEVEKLVQKYKRRPTRKAFQAIYSRFEYITYKTSKSLELRYDEHSRDARDAVIRGTFKAMLQKYSPRDENSRFEGWATKYFWRYADTEMKKQHKKWLDSKKTRHRAMKCFEPYTRNMKQFQQILDTLPKREREVIFAYYHDRLKIKSIAERYGISESTVRTVKMVVLKKIEMKNPSLRQTLWLADHRQLQKNTDFEELKKRHSKHFK